MQTVLTLSVVNLFLSLGLSTIVFQVSRSARCLGEYNVSYTTERIRRRGRGKWRQPYLYLLYIHFDNGVYSMTISEQEYCGLFNQQPEYLKVCVREFTNRLLSPDMQKYAFSLVDTDWFNYDRNRCIKLFFFMFMSFEILILCIGFQL